MAEIDVSLKFMCPTCGARPGDKCLSHRGTARCESHQDRWNVAAHYLPRPAQLAFSMSPNRDNQIVFDALKPPVEETL
jgi:hypothetical protein